MTSATARREPWRARLVLPNYQVQEVARYARISPQTVRNWHKIEDEGRSLFSARDAGEALSYMELIEVAVVSALRKVGLSLKKIKVGRDYIGNRLKSEFPFATYQFKTDGRSLFLDYRDVEKRSKKGTLLDATQSGQLVWEQIVGGLLKEFEYERALGLALRWHVAGLDRPIVIDPRISYGAPNIKGVPTWVLKGRWEAGETSKEIADDFQLSEMYVTDALVFEGIEETDLKRGTAWVN